MDKLIEFTIQTNKYHYFINITDKVEEIVEQSGITKGAVIILTSHTTSGITVNENLECLLSDMDDMLNKIAPEHDHYSHSRMLHSYGQQAGNPTSHHISCTRWKNAQRKRTMYILL